MSYLTMCETLVHAVQKIACLDLLTLEKAATFSEVMPTCHEVFRATGVLVAVIEQIQATYEPDLAIADGFSEAWDESPDTEPQSSRPALRVMDHIRANETGKQRIADLAWFAARALRDKTAALRDSMHASDIWHTIGKCLSAKRMAIKAGTTIEQAMAMELGVPCRLSALYATEVERSLRVRKLYVRFRTNMMPALKPSEAEAEMRLRMASVAFAGVFGELAYDDVRVQDKQLFRKLQWQVLDWMRRRLLGDHDATLRAGLRIWQEAAAFSECLMIINNRAELQNYDMGLASKLYKALCKTDMASQGEIHHFWDHVKQLEGRDEELDRLIADRVPMDDRRWVDALQRIGEVAPGSQRRQGCQPAGVPAF